MDQRQTPEQRPANPRRRKRSQFQIFKETYLPVIIAGVALLLILIILIGSVVRAFQRRAIRAEEAYQASVAAQVEQERQQMEADRLLWEAENLAGQYDYDGAIAALEQFDGDWAKFPEFSEKLEQYKAERESLVLWEDTQNILNLSFQVLIADPDRAFRDAEYGNSYKNHYVTTEEFLRILEQLYQNDYILVSTEDCYSKDTDTLGNVTLTEKPLYLPAGKKPLILTQTNVCYNLYMVDSDDDYLPDSGGAGFAHKLIVDDNGNISAVMIKEDGTEDVGSFDLVPILDSFVETHPDFSYKGARAILALTGFNGILGYRTNQDAQQQLPSGDYDREITNAMEVSNALAENGYEFACYTYNNKAYGIMSAEDMRAELALWSEEVGTLIGRPDIFVFAQQSDISDDKAGYTGEKYDLLKAEGYNLFFGFCADGTPWQTLSGDHVRIGRILVTAANLENNPQWFDGILDPSYVLTAPR